MSTVLWANVLIDGQVKSQESDCYALYKHAGKLNRLTRTLKLPSFKSICDSTDVRFNLGAFKLPEGVDSTDQVMAVEGQWMALAEAVHMLEGLLQHIQSKNIRFGWFSNDQAEVLEELQDVLTFAKAASAAQKFNFSIVM